MNNLSVMNGSIYGTARILLDEESSVDFFIDNSEVEHEIRKGNYYINASTNMLGGTFSQSALFNFLYEANKDVAEIVALKGKKVRFNEYRIETAYWRGAQLSLIVHISGDY